MNFQVPERKSPWWLWAIIMGVLCVAAGVSLMIEYTPPDSARDIPFSQRVQNEQQSQGGQSVQGQGSGQGQGSAPSLQAPAAKPAH